MNLEDLVVEVRDRNLLRVGVILAEDLDIELVGQDGNVGSWKVTLPSEHPLADALNTPGSGIVATGPNDFVFSGSTTMPELSATPADRSGSIVFNGVSDNVIAADALAWPEPSNADAATQAVGHDKRTGPCETLMHEYVMANIGTDAATVRKNPRLIDGEDGGRGPTVTKEARFPVLGTLLSELAVAGNLRFQFVQRSGSIVFETAAIVDRSASVVLSLDNGSLQGQKVATSAPGVTRVIVAGQGEIIDRTFVEVASAASIDAEESWGRRIERFVDQRQTDDPALLADAGMEVLAEEGFTSFQAQSVPMEDSPFEFGKDWNLGDTVGVEVDGIKTPVSITGYVLRANSDGVRLGVVLGSATGFSDQAAIQQRITDTERRVSALERYAPAPRPRGNPGFVRASSGLTVTTTQTLVPGVSVTVRSPATDAIFMVHATADVSQPAEGSTLTVELLVDTVSQTGHIMARGATTGTVITGLRGTYGQTWMVTGLTEGDHTFELVASKNSSSGTFTVNATNTTLAVMPM